MSGEKLVFVFFCAGEDDWTIVIDVCRSLSPKWEQVGGYLGLTISTIDQVRWNHHRDESRCLNEVLKHWIRQDYNTEKFGHPSWRNLLKAIGKIDKLFFKHLAAQHQIRGTLITIL